MEGWKGSDMNDELLSEFLIERRPSLAIPLHSLKLMVCRLFEPALVNNSCRSSPSKLFRRSLKLNIRSMGSAIPTSLIHRPVSLGQ
jgi:hypothetical protein